MNDAEAKPKAEPAAPEVKAAAVGETELNGVPSPEDALKAELEKSTEEAQRLKDQLLRTAADFDNFRKRARKDVEDAQKKGLERALLEILPVSDNLERALLAADKASDVSAIVEGVRMVLKLTEDALGRLGVERVESVGQPFDPGLHEAVQQVESDAPAGTVVYEMVPGYRLNGKLLRAAMVAVARPKVEAKQGNEVEAPKN